MRTEKMPPIGCVVALEKYLGECGRCGNDQVQDALEAVDEQVSKFGLEVVIIEDGSSDYVFKILPKDGLVTLSVPVPIADDVQNYLEFKLAKKPVSLNLLADTNNLVN